MEEKDLFDMFREGSESLTEQPTNDSWKRLERRLASSKATKKRKPLPLQLMVVVAIVALLITAGIVNWVVIKDREAHLKNKDTFFGLQFLVGKWSASEGNVVDELTFSTQNTLNLPQNVSKNAPILRGIKTLHLRVREACKNAEKIAHYLQAHPKVEKVFWPGFATHPNHDIAKKQMRHFGGMVSFDLKGGILADATTVLSGTKLFSLAESLGGVESLIGHPASMTHASIPREERLKVGLTDSLIRLSVGIEDVDDLIEDLENALAKVTIETLATI